MDMWPHLESEYYTILEKFELRKAASEKFNGTIVSDLTGLTDVELGKFIKYLKETDEFTDYQVAALTQEDVDGKIMVKWKLYGEKQET